MASFPLSIAVAVSFLVSSRVKSRKKALAKKQDPLPIPRQWIEDALKIYGDSCWCQAIFLGISHFDPNNNAVDFLSKIMSPKAVQRGVQLANLEIEQASWGTKKDLYNSKTNIVTPGVYKHCTTQKDRNCIHINPDLLGKMGDIQPFKRSKHTIRDSVLAHEGLHKLLDSLKVMAGPLAKLDEEQLVQDIIETYFSRSLFYETFTHTSRAYLALFGACRVFGACDRSPDMSPPQTEPVRTQTGPLPPLPPVDFNKDTIPDSVEVRAFGLPYNAEFRDVPRLWPHATPYIHSADPDIAVWLHKYSGCRVPGVPRQATLWRFNKADLITWPFSFTRFHNTDRSMSFWPAQTVSWQVGNTTSRGAIESILVLLDPSRGIQNGLTYAVLSKCRIVPIDTLKWVTPQGISVDMRRVYTLAQQQTPQVPGHSLSFEDQLAHVVQNISAKISAMGPTCTASDKRDTAIIEAKKSPILTTLPEGWEASLLFFLNLPQNQPVFEKKEPHCISDTK